MRSTQMKLEGPLAVTFSMRITPTLAMALDLGFWAMRTMMMTNRLLCIEMARRAAERNQMRK